MTNTTNTPSTNTPATDSRSTGSLAVAAPVTWFEVHTSDKERAKRFYAEVFGWKYDDSSPYTMVDLGDASPSGGIGGGIVDTGGAYPSHALFMIQVPDVPAALMAAAEHGGSVIADAQTTPIGLVYGYAANPDGSVFGLWCPPAE